jgi:dolichol kinase
MTATTEADRSPLDPELARLVERTEGLQPFRRLFHAGNGLILALVPMQLGIERGPLLAILAAVFAALFVSDVVRLRSRRMNALFFTAFPALASPREADGFASSTWYALGALLAWALFPTHVAVAAILVLGLADPAAGAVGRTWGRVRLGAGTVLGSAAFLFVALLVMAHVVGLPAAIAPALFATAVECLPWNVDDNLTVPLAVGGALWVIGA